jgi:hypothetical protein
MSKNTDHPILDPSVADRMFPNRPTEEIIAELAAKRPDKHGIPLAERLRRVREAAGGEDDAWEGFYRARVLEIGGDPDEMLPGNKPRYTVEEDGSVKDHLTSKVFRPEA